MLNYKLQTCNITIHPLQQQLQASSEGFAQEAFAHEATTAATSYDTAMVHTSFVHTYDTWYVCMICMISFSKRQAPLARAIVYAYTVVPFWPSDDVG